jgi:hypothetical protein
VKDGVLMGLALQIGKAFGPLVNSNEIMFGIHTHRADIGAAIVIPMTRKVLAEQGINRGMRDIPEFTHQGMFKG